MPSIASLTMLTRIGFAARGIMYFLIGYFALRFGRTEDGPGVLESLQSGSGKVLLVLMGVGFLAYALWRLSEAVLDTEGHGSDAKGKAVRAGGAMSGLIHLGLGLFALSLGFGQGSGGSGGGSGGTEKGAEAALSIPGGTLLLTLAALVLAVTGAFQLVKAVKGDFLKHLDPQAARRDWVQWLGRAGYAARGIVFLLVGWFLFRAAREDSADQAAGTAEALTALPTTLQTVVAAGLLLFGLFSLVEARYRRINDPHLGHRLKQQAGALDPR